MTIWKYEAAIEDQVSISVPNGATLVKVGIQRPRVVTFWYLCAPDRPIPLSQMGRRLQAEQGQKEIKTFNIEGTGHPVDPATKYIDTIFDPPFVWHVFEVVT
jgi:hypothetical protein